MGIMLSNADRALEQIPLCIWTKSYALISFPWSRCLCAIPIGSLSNATTSYALIWEADPYSTDDPPSDPVTPALTGQTRETGTDAAHVEPLSYLTITEVGLFERERGG